MKAFGLNIKYNRQKIKALAVANKKRRKEA